MRDDVQQNGPKQYKPDTCDQLTKTVCRKNAIHNLNYPTDKTKLIYRYYVKE